LNFSEPWELWERFGACFYALRINALLVMGNQVVSVATLFYGAHVVGCEQRVILRPVTVEYSGTEFSVNMGEMISLKRDRQTQKSWLGGDSNHVWLNQAGGDGIDIFFFLPSADSLGTYVVIVDQRKRVAKSLGSITAKKLLAKANIIPELGDKKVFLIRGLCNVLPHSELQGVPEDCFFVNADNCRHYHASLAFHPVANSVININHDSKSSLLLVLLHNNAYAAAVMEEREKRRFTGLEDLLSFLEEKFEQEVELKYPDQITF